MVTSFVESVFVILCLYIRSSWLVSARSSLASNLEYRHNSTLNPVGPVYQCHFVKPVAHGAYPVSRVTSLVDRPDVVTA